MECKKIFLCHIRSCKIKRSPQVQRQRSVTRRTVAWTDVDPIKRNLGGVFLLTWHAVYCNRIYFITALGVGDVTYRLQWRQTAWVAEYLWTVRGKVLPSWEYCNLEHRLQRERPSPFLFSVFEHIESEMAIYVHELFSDHRLFLWSW
jgi:hypothetical protein